MDDNKINWMLEELRDDEYFITRSLLERILANDIPDFVEDSLVDYIQELQSEWEVE